MPDTSVPLPLERVAFDRLRSFPRLFHDYATVFTPLADCFPGDPRLPEARAAAVARAAAYPRDLDMLADVLTEQNDRWGLDETTRMHIEWLRQPGTVAVVTGQQVGLLGGPLYTLLKTVTTVQLAGQLAAETGRRVVPVFWLEGEDHDFDEIAGLWLLRGNEPVHLRYTLSGAVGPRGPVGRLVLDGGIEPWLAEVEAALPPTEFRDSLMAAVRTAYRPGVTLLDAFARLLRAIFAGTGLVLVDPSDPRLKRPAAPLFRREIDGWTVPAGAVRRAGERLAPTYHVQVTPRPTNLFLVDETGRHGIEADGAGFRLRGTARTLSREALLEHLEAAPAAFSPNVVLRPIVQDLLLPTALYVAGPGEVSYFAQYRGVYEWAGVPMPLIYPRASATLVEAKVGRVLDRLHLDLTDLEADLEPLFRRLVLGSGGVDLEAVFGEASGSVRRAVEALLPAVGRVDHTLEKTVEATAAAMAKELDRLRERVAKAQKRQHDELRGHLEKARAALFPGGKLQERSLAGLHFLARYGPGFADMLRQRLSLDTTAHQVVRL